MSHLLFALLKRQHLQSNYMLSQDCSDAVCKDIDGDITIKVFIKLMFDCLQVQDTCLARRLLAVVGVWC